MWRIPPIRHLKRKEIKGLDFCPANAFRQAHPYGYKGKQLRDIKGYHGAPLGETIMQNAAEGTIKQTTYWWPRPGTDTPLEKTAFYTKVSDQICGVGFYTE